ncbi:unnamed protein product [Arctogadus glacialis]
MKAIEDGAGALSIMLTGLVIGWMGTVGTQRLTEADLFPESREDREWRGEPEDEDRSKKLFRLHGLVAPTKGWPGPSPFLPQNQDL